jgi:cytochrome c oxidase subunit III
LSDSPAVVAHGHVHNPALRHHFADMDQQRESAELGMWLFLVTEIMFFGGMFCAYMVYRYMYPQAWEAGSEQMDFWFGTINTVVLICSSLTMALAVRAAQVGQKNALVALLIITMLFGCVFMGIKGVEYYGHWTEHQFPGANFHFDGPDVQHVQIFFFLYWAMTGLHAFHMLIGIVLVGLIAYWGWRGKYGPDYYNPVENTGLYWHFVDMVWIYLYPLLYLLSHKHAG